MKNEIGIAGYFVGDYHPAPQMDVNFFRTNHTYGDGHEFIEGIEIPDNDKASIRPSEYGSFFKFLEKHAVKRMPGGGGRNSAAVFKKIGYDVAYFDTSKKPEFDLGIGERMFFAEMCDTERALVLKSSKGTTNIRSGRGDKGVPLEERFKGNLISFLNQGNDFFVNSVSNEDLAYTVSEEIQDNANLYVLVTDHLPKRGIALRQLLKRADSTFFSFTDFYKFADKAQPLNLDGKIGEEALGELTRDIQEAVRAGKMHSNVFVSMGKHGIVAYDSGKNESHRVYLDLKEEDKLKAHMDERGIGTNGAGDTISAKIVDNMRNGMNIRDAAVSATQYVIETLFNYKVDREKIVIETLDVSEKPKNRIVGDIGVLERTLYPEDDVLK